MLLFELLSVHYCKMERIKLQFGFWMLWTNWFVSFALESEWMWLFELQFGCYEQTWNWTVSFVVSGCDCSLYCQSRSWRQIYLIFIKFSGASPPNSIYFPLSSDSFLEANCLSKISKIFGASPRNRSQNIKTFEKPFCFCVARRTENGYGHRAI